MTRKQARKHDRICTALAAVIGMVLIVHTAVAAFRGRQERRFPEESKYKTTEELQAEYRQQEAVIEQKECPQVAVVEVILNRVESDNYPNTVKGVITQPGAFTSWSNGSIEAAPFDDECCEAVQDALNERIFPVTVVWFREGHFHPFGTQYTVIGNHYFSSEEEVE